MNLREKLKNIGPGVLVTAAFIGRGTITKSTLTGAGFGYALLWGLVFSVLATIILQEMTARLGVIGQLGLGDAVRGQMRSPIAKFLAAMLILSAILIGNAAYETGNILGASLGIQEISGLSKVYLGSISFNLWGPVIGIIAFIILMIGNYKFLERILTGLVLMMSLAFILTMFMIGPDILSILKGMFIPSMPAEAVFMLIGLIGTTVVPYNLFLHASVVKEKWKGDKDLKTARTDLILAVVLGGVVSMSIVITSAVAFYGTNTEISGAGELAGQLKPLLGNFASGFISFGLFAAGISSAITAPLAAAYASCGILGWETNLKSKRFKAIWMLILFIGILFSALEFSPIQAIVFAQFANGILLPIIAIYLLITMNNKNILGERTNSLKQNILGMIVVAIMIGLGLKSIFHVIGIL